MNRSGLSNTVFEMDDDMSAYTADGIAEANLDGAKVLWRLDPNEPGSGKTLMYIAEAVSELSAMGLPSFLEPLPVKRTGKRLPTGQGPHRTAQADRRAIGFGRQYGAHVAEDFPCVRTTSAWCGRRPCRS